MKTRNCKENNRKFPLCNIKIDIKKNSKIEIVSKLKSDGKDTLKLQIIKRKWHVISQNFSGGRVKGRFLTILNEICCQRENK